MTLPDTSTSAVVDALLDPSYLHEITGRDIQVSRIRIKPETSVVAAVMERSTASPAGWVRVLWPKSHNKACGVAERSDVTTKALSPELLFQSGSISSDPKLGAFLSGDEQMDRILRYNPARRVVFQHHDRVVRVTVRADELATPLYRALRQVVPLPARVDDGSDPHRSAQQFCGDADLSAQLSEAKVAEAGALFARLHAATAPASLVPALRRQRGNFGSQMAAHVRLFGHLAPELAQRTAELTQAAAWEFTGPAVLCHGDASPDQVLVERSGPGMWLTDFERACLAPAAIDLGSFFSSLSDAHRTAFAQGYRSAGGTSPTDVELLHARIQARLVKVAEPLRMGVPQWRSQIAAGLKDIATELDGGTVPEVK